jgi:hypothetical protein
VTFRAGRYRVEVLPPSAFRTFAAAFWVKAWRGSTGVYCIRLPFVVAWRVNTVIPSQRERGTFPEVTR